MTKLNWKHSLIKCKRCGIEFRPVRPWQKFCSKANGGCFSGIKNYYIKKYPERETRRGFKNSPLAEETRRKLSLARLGKPGHKKTEEEKRRIGEANKKIWTEEKKRSWSGENSPSWRGGLKKNKAHLLEQQRKWVKENAYRIRWYAHLRWIRKKGANGTHSQEDWENLKTQYNWTCPRCKRQEPEIKLTEDHIIPLSKGGSDNIENIQPLCKSCNSSKGTKLLGRFLSLLFIPMTIFGLNSSNLVPARIIKISPKTPETAIISLSGAKVAPRGDFSPKNANMEAIQGLLNTLILHNRGKIEKLINCESGGRNVTIVDSNKKFSRGILQIQDHTWRFWNDLRIYSGLFPLDTATNTLSAIEMADWAIDQGFISAWTCSKLLKLKVANS